MPEIKILAAWDFEEKIATLIPFRWPPESNSKMTWDQHLNESMQAHTNTQKKGCCTYRITPRDHKSALWLYGCSRTSSGAMYSGVPGNDE
jgi:hypothetical protein